MRSAYVLIFTANTAQRYIPYSSSSRRLNSQTFLQEIGILLVTKLLVQARASNRPAEFLENCVALKGLRDPPKSLARRRGESRCCSSMERPRKRGHIFSVPRFGPAFARFPREREERGADKEEEGGGEGEARGPGGPAARRLSRLPSPEPVLRRPGEIPRLSQRHRRAAATLRAPNPVGTSRPTSFYESRHAPPTDRLAFVFVAQGLVVPLPP